MVQPQPKQMTREDKEQKVEEFRKKIEDYPVIGVLDMHELPSRQLQQIKKQMKEFADIKMSRKTLMDIAIDKAEKEDIDQLKQNDAVQPAFIFSRKDPFQLYALIQDNKTSAAAAGGEESPDDIEIPEGDTGIGPGPMLGKLQGAGLDVQVEDGTIHVQEPGVVVEKGETITPDIAEILNQVGIEPLEVGLDLTVAYSEGELFEAEDLEIDTGEYREQFELGSSRAFNLAVEAGVVNDTTAAAIVGRAARKARNLSVSEGVVTEETAEEIVSRAASNARGLDSRLDVEDVEIEEDEAEEAGDEEEAEKDEPEEDEENDTGDGEEDSGGEEESFEEADLSGASYQELQSYAKQFDDVKGNASREDLEAALEEKQG